MRRVISLFIVCTAALVGLSAGPAAAAGNYPPTTPPANTGVLGTKTGQVSNSGLPHTGFDPTLLWIAMGLVVVGLLVIASSRARRARRWPQ